MVQGGQLLMRVGGVAGVGCAPRIFDSVQLTTPAPHIELACYDLRIEPLTAEEMIQSATIHDIPRIQEIINSHAELGKMLFKSYAQLYEDLRDFAVYVKDGKIVGAVALAILWADLAEIRSLAVDSDYFGQGIGRRLAEWAVEEARRLQIRKIMSLTYEQAFFAKLDFAVVPKETLPLKVWSDCVRCPKRDDCDEIAMVRELTDVPMIVMPTAAPTPRGVSIPVLGEIED